MTLKPILETGDHSCTWLVPGLNGADCIRLSGTLDVQPNRPPTGTGWGEVPMKYYESGTGSVGASSPQSRAVGVVEGHLISGVSITLLDAVLEVWAPERLHLSAAAAVIGAHRPAGWPTGQPPTPSTEPSEPHFTSVRLQIEGLDEIAGIAPLKSFTFPQSGLNGTWSIEGQPDSAQAWTDEEAVVELEFSGSASIGDPYRFRMGFSPVCTITATPANLQSWLSDWVQPLRGLCCLLTGQRREISFWTASLAALDAIGPESDPPDVQSRYGQVFGTALTQELFESDYATLRRGHSSVRLHSDGVSLLSLLRAWQLLAAEQHPLIDTYTSFLSARSQLPRSRFLLIVQALEGAYGTAHRAKLARASAAYAGKRDKAIATAKGELDVATFRFVKANLSREPRASLDTALRAHFQPFPTLRSELGASKLVSELADDPRTDKHPESAVRVARNRLAHGAGSFTHETLTECSDILERLTRCLLLELLGLDRELVERAALNHDF